MTAPIAVELAPLIGGNPALPVAVVVATGVLGQCLDPGCRIARECATRLPTGLTFGTEATGIGTAQAAMLGEMLRAVAGVAMGVAAVLLSTAASVFIHRLRQLLICKGNGRERTGAQKMALTELADSCFQRSAQIGAEVNATELRVLAVTKSHSDHYEIAQILRTTKCSIGDSTHCRVRQCIPNGPLAATVRQVSC